MAAPQFISVLHYPQRAGLMLTRWTFSADTATGLVSWPMTGWCWLGTLYRLSCMVTGVGITETYTITILDAYGQDVLRGKLVSQVSNNVDPQQDDLTVAVASAGDRPLIVAGCHRFTFTAVDPTDLCKGQLDVYWAPGYAARLDHAGMTR